MKRINIFLIAVVLIAGVVGCGDESEHHITWSPPKISTAVTPGGSWEGSMSFISNMDFGEAELSVEPELETFVSVYPQSFSNATAGNVNTFEVSIVVPPGATVDEAYDGTMSLTVGGQDCPGILEVRLYVAAPLDTVTEESYNATMALEMEASELFWDTEEQSGTQEAQQITLEFLQEQTEVFDTGISESGSIWIIYKDGIHALISTSPPGTLRSGYQSEDMGVLDNAFMSTADSMTPGNTRAILLCPIYSEAEMQPLGIQEAMTNVKDSLEGIGYDTTPVYDDDVTVDLLKSLYLYGVVDFMTHGDVWSNQVVLMTGEEATFSSFRAHLSDWKAHRLARRSAVYGIFVECNWWIRPSFVTHYADEPYPNSIVVATACSSFAKWSMADAFLGAGVYVYAGWTDTTRAELGINSKLRLYECLTGGMSLQEAFNTLVDEGLTVNPSRGERFFFYPLAAGDFVLVGEEEAVYFPDPNLEAAIREAIDKPTGDIYPSDLEDLTILYAHERDISDLTGLEHCTSLTYLKLNANQISDVSALSDLTSLTYLDVYANQISDVSPLASLTSLTCLSLWGNQISDISALSNLTDLTYLNLHDNQISDISALSNLTDLSQLYLHDNQISDVSALSNLINLSRLWLGNNEISDISALSNLTNLTSMDLSFNQIASVSVLANLISLSQLFLSANQISDVSGLSNLINLSRLWLGDNQISDISALSNLVSLSSLWLGDNQISDISALSNLTSLTHLDLSVNQISNISALSNLTELTRLYLWGNQISDISALASLTSLTYLDIDGNEVSDISPLVENEGLDTGDTVWLQANPLSSDSINIYIPELEARGVTVHY